MLTATELAKELKVSLAAVRLWQRHGLPCVPVGRLRRYRLDDVLRWFQQRTEQKQLQATAKREEVQANGGETNVQSHA